MSLDLIMAAFALGCICGFTVGWREWHWRSERWRESAAWWRGLAEKRGTEAEENARRSVDKVHQP